MNLRQLIASRKLHRQRYSWARGDLAAVRADARAGGNGRTPGVITKEEAAAIHAAEARVAEELSLIRRRDQQIARMQRTGRPRESFVMNVRNQSGRGGVRPTLIVLHTTESDNRDGLEDLRAIGAWFNNPSSWASSHVGVDFEGNSCTYVPDAMKAWTCAAFNSRSLNIEQVGRADQGGFTQRLYVKTAEYIAYWHDKYGIPITSSTSSGVCRHSDLGVAGGGHHDPGSKYDLGHVLELARGM